MQNNVTFLKYASNKSTNEAKNYKVQNLNFSTCTLLGIVPAKSMIWPFSINANVFYFNVRFTSFIS